MKKSLLKFITDFGPLLIFFIVYYKNENDLSIAIPPFIIATLISLAVIYIIEKKNTDGTFDGWNFNHLIWRINFIFQ